jgi:bla regulator protein BlaR1
MIRKDRNPPCFNNITNSNRDSFHMFLTALFQFLLSKFRHDLKIHSIRRNHLTRPRIAALAGASACLLFSLWINAPLSRAQNADWEKAAGGKMSFDVASVKLNTSGEFEPANFSLDANDGYLPTGGLLRAPSFQLITFIQFAYKLQLTPGQVSALLANLPRWFNVDRFDIEARGPANATKDQMRLMMQSLLADRFKLAVHFEPRQQPVFAMLPEKPGKTGPQLIPHSQGPPCDDSSKPKDPSAPTTQNLEVFPAACEVFMVHGVTGKYLEVGARDTTMARLAATISTMPGEEINRPVIDKTELAGRFDLILKYTGDVPRVDMHGVAEQFDNSQPTFLTALKEQLGLRLVAQTAPVRTLFIDHVEEPSAN